jgi:hypothetical protein
MTIGQFRAMKMPGLQHALSHRSLLKPSGDQTT